MRILNIVTVSMSARLFHGRLAFLKRCGWETALCSSPGSELHDVAAEADGVAFEVPMEREIAPLRDVVALWRLYRLMRRYRPAIVDASTPKAGLLGMLAARLAGVPVRVYMLRGLRLETATGAKAFLLRLVERIAAVCATQIFCVSESLKRAYVDRGMAPEEKSLVLGAGSSNGVDTVRFCRDDETRQQAERLREAFGWPAAAPVVGFVGRLTRDKGIVELAKAFRMLLAELPDTRLLLVGDFEAADPLPEDCIRWLRDDPRVVVTGFVADPKAYYAVMEVLAFSSYREGFPNVPLEAAAMELPVVATRVSGCVDAVSEGVTGELVPSRDAPALAEAIRRYLADPALRRRHGQAGRDRAVRDFRPEVVWEAIHREYVRLLRESRLDTPNAVTREDRRAAA
jgi:glycosyltransferase involved in cell wall biosynthesis